MKSLTSRPRCYKQKRQKSFQFFEIFSFYVLCKQQWTKTENILKKKNDQKVEEE